MYRTPTRRERERWHAAGRPARSPRSWNGMLIPSAIGWPTWSEAGPGAWPSSERRFLPPWTWRRRGPEDISGRRARSLCRSV